VLAWCEIECALPSSVEVWKARRDRIRAALEAQSDPLTPPDLAAICELDGCILNRRDAPRVSAVDLDLLVTTFIEGSDAVRADLLAAARAVRL
jgi:hypothetical protein